MSELEVTTRLLHLFQSEIETYMDGTETVTEVQVQLSCLAPTQQVSSILNLFFMSFLTCVVPSVHQFHFKFILLGMSKFFSFLFPCSASLYPG
jgi:hypothetical protein